MTLQRRDFLGLLGLGGLAAALPAGLRPAAAAPTDDGLYHIPVTSQGKVYDVVLGTGKVPYVEPTKKPFEVVFEWDDGNCALKMDDGEFEWTEYADSAGYIEFNLQGYIEWLHISDEHKKHLAILMDKGFKMRVIYKNNVVVFDDCRLHRLETDLRALSMQGGCTVPERRDSTHAI